MTDLPPILVAGLFREINRHLVDLGRSTGISWTSCGRPPRTTGTGRRQVRSGTSRTSAWKLFTKRMGRETALARFKDITFEGDRELGLHVLDMVALMA
jgi:hypothetical protein